MPTGTAEQLKPRLDVEYSFLSDGATSSTIPTMVPVPHQYSDSELLEVEYAFRVPSAAPQEQGKLQLAKLKFRMLNTVYSKSG